MSARASSSLWELCAAPVPDLQRERYERLRAMMEEEQLDALVVLATATLGRKGNLRYVSNYSPVSRYGCVVFPRQGEPVLLVPYAVHAAWAEKISWVEDVRFHPDFVSAIAAILDGVGWARGTIGLAGEDSIAGLAEGLARQLASARLVSAEKPLAALRLITGVNELAMARQAAAMADSVFTETVDLIAAGVSESEIFAVAEARLRRQHAEDSLLLIDSVGEQVSPFPTVRTIAQGDVVQYSVEPVSPGGHWIQSVRMFSRGEPHRTVRNVVEQCIRALNAAQLALRPGVPICDVAGVLSEILEPFAPQGTIPYGHGIGMDNFEAPLLSVQSDEVAQENMLIVIHPALVVEGRYFYLGDTYLVTKDGAERLSEYPLDLMVV